MVEHKGQSHEDTSGSSRPDFEAQITQLKKEVAAVAETVSEATSDQLLNVKERAGEAAGDLEGRVRKDPWTSMAVVAGVSLVLGALISR